MGLPGTDLNLGQKIKKVKFKKKNKFCPRFKSALAEPQFPTTQNSKKLFLIC